MGPLPTRNLRQAINARHGTKSKANCIFKKGRTIKNQRHLRTLLNAYLDENTKKDAVKLSQTDLSRENYSDLILEGVAPQRPGIDYVLTNGSVRTFGFLSERVAALAATPFEPPSNDWPAVIAEEWLSELGNKKKLGVNFVFSVDPRFGAALGADEIPIDGFLNAAVSEALLAFNNRFYAGKSLGWISGIHHDRHHTHAHVLLYPRTSDGTELCVSDGALRNVNGKMLRIDYQQVIHDAYKQAIARRLAIARGPDLSDPDRRKKIIVEMRGGVRWAEQELKKSGTEFGPTDAINKWFEGMGTVITPATLNEHRNFYAGKTNLGLQTPEHFDMVDEVLRKQLAGAEALTKRIAKVRKNFNRQFDILRQEPAAYRQVVRKFGHQAVSPSGTLSYLKQATKGEASFNITRSEIDRAMTSAWGKYDQLLKETITGGLSEQMIDPTSSLSQQLRSGLSAMAGFSVIETLRRLRGMPPMAYEIDLYTKATSKTLEQSRDFIGDAILQSIRSVGYSNRSATFKELEELDARKRSLNLKRKLLGDEADEESSEPEKIFIPQVAPLVSSLPNFLQREIGNTGIRTFEDMLNESSAIADKLSKVLTAPGLFAFPSI